MLRQAQAAPAPAPGKHFLIETEDEDNGPPGYKSKVTSLYLCSRTLNPNVVRSLGVQNKSLFPDSPECEDGDIDCLDLWE